MTKNNSYERDALHVAHRPILTARIDHLINSPNTHVKAYATVNLGGWYAVHGLRIIDSQKGLFVQMPQNSFTKGGKTIYEDVFHPVTADARHELLSTVLKAYEQKLAEENTQTDTPQREMFPEVTAEDPDDPFSEQETDPPFEMSM